MPKNTQTQTDSMGRKVTIEEQTCKRCGHKFWPRVVDGKIRIPIHCPRCNNQYWNRPIKHPTISKAQKERTADRTHPR